MATINMQTMRYINLLDRFSNVKTSICFNYNNTIFFAVSRDRVSRAIGPDAFNVRKIQESLGKKVKIIREPEGISDAQRFISDIVSPIKFKEISLGDGAIIITAGNSQSKASLIGRNKRRLDELKQIVHDNFGVDLKVI